MSSLLLIGRRVSTVVQSPRLPVACAAVAVAALLAAVPYRIFESGYLNYVSGAWTTLADDLAHGVLYRPLVSDVGYGGTRYFPLHAVLHGLLIRLGFSARVGGHLVSLASACLLVLGGALALSKRGASRELAWSGGLLALASRTAFMAVAGVRGDLLPLALGVLGIGLIPRDEDESVVPAAACLGLALVAKPTLIWAPAGVLIAGVAAARIKTTSKLLAIAAGVTMCALAAAVWASRGEMLASFRACASGGNVSLAMMSALGYTRPGDLAWMLGGAALTLARGRRGLSDPVCAAGLVSVVITVLLFSSRGIHVNNLVDATSLGALATSSAVADGGLEKVRAWACRVLVAGTVLGTIEAMLLDGMTVKRGDLEQTAAVLPAGKDPVLSEQPWVPLLMGERPFLLDAFSLVQTRLSSAAVDQDLLERVRSCRFRAVVLLGRPEKEPWWYDGIAFGSGFKEQLLASYSFAGVVGGHGLYFPRCGTTAAAATSYEDGETVFDRMHRPGFLQQMKRRFLGR